MLRRPAIALVALGLAACSTTRLQRTWVAPGADTIRPTNLVVLVVAPDEAVRRTAEQRLCERVAAATRCTPAYRFLPDPDRADADLVRQLVEARGFDAGVVLRVAGAQDVTTYVVPSTPMWGWYGAGWGGARDGDHTRQTRLVDVETALYALPKAVLLWTGTTSSMSPTDVRRTVDEIVDAVVAGMRHDGVLPAAR